MKYSVILTGLARDDLDQVLELMAEQGAVNVETLYLEHFDHIVVGGERVDIPATKYTAEVGAS